MQISFRYQSRISSAIYNVRNLRLSKIIPRHTMPARNLRLQNVKTQMRLRCIIVHDRRECLIFSFQRRRVCRDRDNYRMPECRKLQNIMQIINHHEEILRSCEDRKIASRRSAQLWTAEDYKAAINSTRKARGSFYL